MVYLIANILFASAFTLIIKWAQVRGRVDVLSSGAVNYIVAALWSLPEFVGNDVEAWSASAIGTGALMGGCYFVAFFFVVHAIKYVGVSSTTGIAVLSILVPILAGILIWGERPNGYQVIGVAFALFSLTLIGAPRKVKTKEVESDPTKSDEARTDSADPSKADPSTADPAAARSPWKTTAVLVTFFLLAGASRLAQEAFKHVSTADQRPTFLFAAFALAAIPSVVMLVRRRQRLLPIEIAFGFMMGASNILQSHYMLKALEYYDGFIVFPAVSAGSLMLTTIVATRILGEKLGGRALVGIMLATAALFLLNYLPE